MSERLYIVAECGGTHNGLVETARRLIDAAARAGADAVKFTMRDLDAEMSPQLAAMPYDGPHSYGATYGEHRKALELSWIAHREIGRYARDAGLEYGLTVCSPSCVGWIDEHDLQPDWLKIASRDALNVPLLEAIRDGWSGPVVISDGAASIEDLTRAILLQSSRPVTVLHCISVYPARLELMGTSVGRRLATPQPAGPPVDHGPMGYSDHVPGWHACIAAVARGARWIEKHLTLDCTARGTDHQHSLEPEEFARMVYECRDVAQAGSQDHMRLAESWPTFARLGRSVAVNRDMDAGETLTEDCLHMVSPGTGLPWAAVRSLVHRELAVAKKRNELLRLEDVR